MRKLLFFSLLLILNLSCNTPTDRLSEKESLEIASSAKEVVQQVFDYSNNMDFKSGLNHYSNKENAYFVTDGVIHSLSELKTSYEAVGPYVEHLHNTINDWHIEVLSKNIVVVTLPVTLQLKMKGITEYTGELIWTATLEKEEGEWIIVQSHESWLNCAEVAAALAPPKE